MSFRGHKIYGPTGIGILYGKEKWLEEFPPFQGGGDMVDIVTFEKTTYNSLPFKFEAGTPNYIGAIGLASALNYVSAMGIDNIAHMNRPCLNMAPNSFTIWDLLHCMERPEQRVPSCHLIYRAFILMMPEWLWIRWESPFAPEHIAHRPVMQHFGIEGTIRASLAMYNTMEELDVLVEAVKKVKTMFG